MALPLYLVTSWGLERSKRLIALFWSVWLLSANAVSGEDRELDARPFYFGEHVEGLTEVGRADFLQGSQVFSKIWSIQEGLGPTFSAESCVHCHRDPLPGGSGSRGDSFVNLSSSHSDRHGGFIFPSQRLVGTNKVLETLPVAHVLRRSPPLFGLGLLESVSQAEIIGREDPLDKDNDGISGRAVRSGNSIGRFGIKAKISTIEEFVGLAFALEIGLDNLVSRRFRDGDFSNSQHSDISIQEMQAVATFIRYLGPPPRRNLTDGGQGSDLFRSLRCAGCHLPELKARLNGKSYRFFPYTDLLLHDLGEPRHMELDEQQILSSEYRTAPLWGLHSVGPPFWHDGSASSIVSAILLHKGEGEFSRKMFESLSIEKQAVLLDFLNSL